MNVQTIQGKNREEVFKLAKEQYADRFSLINLRELKKGLVEMVILVEDEVAPPPPKPKPNNPYAQNAQTTLPKNRPLPSAKKIAPKPPSDDLLDQSHLDNINQLSSEAKELSNEINKILQSDDAPNDTGRWDNKPQALLSIKASLSIKALLSIMKR